MSTPTPFDFVDDSTLPISAKWASLRAIVRSHPDVGLRLYGVELIAYLERHHEPLGARLGVAEGHEDS